MPEVFRDHTVVRTSDLDAAHDGVSRAFLPHRLHLRERDAALDMKLNSVRLGGVMAAYLRYGRPVGLQTSIASHYHVNIPLTGRAESRCGHRDPVPGGPGHAAVFMPGSPADLRWSGDCEQLCVMIDRTALDGALEVLLGRAVTRPIEFAPHMDLTSVAAARWLDLLRAFRNRFDDPDRFPSSGAHLEGLLVHGLLFAQPHEHLAELVAWRPPSPPRAVRQAIDLLEGRPRHTWSTGELARAVFVSPRSLQEGFRRSVGRTPMAYLREVRLDQAHSQLATADPAATNVTEVALRWGFVHLGRFASAYRRRFGRPPSETLRGG